MGSLSARLTCVRTPARLPLLGSHRANAAPRTALKKTSLEKTRMKVLLLENVHERAVESFVRNGYTTVERHAKALAGDELARRDRRRPLRGHPLGYAAHGGGDRAGAQAHRGRSLLHRHEPGRPRRGDDARHPGLQRALLEHALGRRAGARRDHPPASRDPGEERAPPPRRVAEGDGRRARGSRPQARHRRLRQHRLAAVGDGRGARHGRLLPRRRQQAAPGQRAARGVARRAPRDVGRRHASTCPTRPRRGA